MRFLDFVILLILFGMLFAGLYLLYLNLPTPYTKFETFSANISKDLPSKSVQFYPNMRYIDKKISYSLSSNCTKKRMADFESAVALLEQKTILSFYKSENPEIIISCSNIAPMSTEEDHFIAGEGGPSQIINGTKFGIILFGKIALYRPESCDEPKIATHELLHALGFDHNNNESSVMYPLTSCSQEIDQYIINEINRLYSIPSQGDLFIEQLSANKSGRFFNFEATMSNEGLKKVGNFSLNILADGSLIKTFEIEGLDIGSKRRISVTNLRIPRNAEKIILQVLTTEPEITKENNVAEIKAIESQN